MAGYSRLSCTYKNDDLFISINGDLDGSSACELVNAIHEGYQGKGSIYINIKKTCRVLPFGMDTFSSRLNRRIVPKDSIIFLDEKNKEGKLKTKSSINGNYKKPYHCDGKCAVCTCKSSLHEVSSH